MLSIIFILLSLFWIVIGILFADDSEGFSLIFIIGALVFNMIGGYSHISDLATIRSGDAFIQIGVEAIKEIDEQLEKYPTTSTMLNSDTPIASYIQAKSEYLKDIVETKKEIQVAKRNIVGRKLGTGAWFIWVFGEE